MSPTLMVIVLPCIVLGIIIVCMAMYAWFSSAKVRINISSAAGALACAIAVGIGWEYGSGDVGLSTGWPILLILGCYISMFSPFGGFVQIIALLADVGVANGMGMTIVDGYEWLVLATLWSVLVLISMALPIGPNSRARRGRISSAGC